MTTQPLPTDILMTAIGDECYHGHEPLECPYGPEGDCRDYDLYVAAQRVDQLLLRIAEATQDSRGRLAGYECAFCGGIHAKHYAEEWLITEKPCPMPDFVDLMYDDRSLALLPEEYERPDEWPEALR